MDPINLKKNAANGQLFDATRFNDDQTAIETAINKLINSVTDGDSGGDALKMTPISAIDATANTAQSIIEALITLLNGSTGADQVGATNNVLSGSTIQDLLQNLTDKLKSTTDGSAGADFVNATAIAGLSGTTVQALLEALESALTTHKSSADHDGRYYTETELNNGQLDTRYYTETELNNGQLDNRYYTETEVDGFSVKLTGNQTVAGVKTFSSSPIVPAPTTDLQASTKKYVDDTVTGVVLGQITDNSLTNAKLATDIKVGSLASLTTTEKGSVVGAINELDSDFGTLNTTVSNLTTTVNNGLLESSLELAKGLFTLQAQMASGLNSLSQMAIDAFNDETGIASKTNQTYDSTNDLYKPTIIRTAKTVTASGNARIQQEGVGKSVTAVGNAQISTTQSKFGGASGYFDGTGDGLTTPDTDDWHFGSGDFTIDFWMHPTAAPSSNHCLFGQNISTQCPIQFWFQTDRILKVYISFDNTNWLGGTHSFATSALTLNTWTHIAFVRTGNDFKLFVNGTQAGSTVTNSSSFTNYAATLYMFYDKYAGYADEVRVSKGIARWTTNFTAPTTAYIADTYTKLLLHFEGSNASSLFLDDSENIRPKFGTGMGYFDGNGDYLTVPDSADWDFGTGDFTLEAWVYQTINTGFQCFIDRYDATAYTWQLGLSDGKPSIYVRNSAGTGSIINYTSLNAISLNTWTHIVMTKESGNIKLWVNGTLDTTISANYALDSSLPITIGKQGNASSYYFNGYIDELRISKGIARHTANFSVPTSQLTADTNTVLLLNCNGTNGSTTFTDTVGVNSMTLISNALTCASAPAKGYVVVDDTANGATLTYSLSRDNGTTWTTATKDTLVDISGQPSGTQLKIKAVTSGGDENNLPLIKAWAFGYK